MGITYINIELVNAVDASNYRNHKIGEDEVRKIEINAMVDTGSVMLAINESILAALGLDVIGERNSVLANGQRLKLPVAGPIMVWYSDRFCMTDAIVLPDDEEPLFGAIPMEEMDLYVHPARNEILPMHPDGPLMMLK